MGRVALTCASILAHSATPEKIRKVRTEYRRV